MNSIQASPPGSGAVRIAILMPTLGLLEDFEVDPAPLLDEFNLTRAFFEEPENTVPYTTYGKWMGRCREMTGCQHFGLLVGQRLNMSALGAIGFLMHSMQNVGMALNVLARSFELHDRGAGVELTTTGGYAMIEYFVITPDVEAVDMLHDLAVAAGVNFMRALCAGDWVPTQVLIAHRKPRNVAPYRAFFRTPPTFDSDHTGLVFPASTLERKVPSADPLLQKFMEQHIRNLQSTLREDLVGQVRRVIRTMILSGHACNREEVAAKLGLRSRTLLRRLEGTGTSFAKLRDEVRYETARNLLETTTMTARQIGLSVGYEDYSAFARAFQRWSGIAPMQWRGKA